MLISRLSAVKNSALLILAAALVIIGCQEDEGLSVAFPEDASVFVWNSMNRYYFWQQEVENLADESFDSQEQRDTYLNTFDTPEELFGSLLYEDDKFSWIVDDYVALENSFQGVSKSFGYEFQLISLNANSNDLIGYVEYVVPDSPASEAGLQRGDIFDQVDGVQLTRDNFNSLLFEVDAYTLSFIDLTSGSPVPADRTVSLIAVELTENPILVSKVIDVGGVRVGYLVYNQFINNNAFHSELNSVFAEFNIADISELVLDLRYNPGGSLTTSRILASMIYGAATDSTVFGSILYNEKLSEFNSDLTFLSDLPVFDTNNEQIGAEIMNRLSIERIYILTSNSTASASELIIAGLIPYMDVTLIGGTTVGKNVGSVTLYDSPDEGYLSNDVFDLNPNHTYAIQPIISQLANSEGFSNYIDGFNPNVEVKESDFLADLKPLGDVSEPFLEEALAIIGGTGRLARPHPLFEAEAFRSSRARKSRIQTIHVDLPEIRDLLELK